METLAILYLLSGLIAALSVLRGKTGLYAEFSLIALTWPVVVLIALYIRWLEHKGVDRPLNLRLSPKKKLAPNRR